MQWYSIYALMPKYIVVRTTVNVGGTESPVIFSSLYVGGEAGKHVQREVSIINK